MTTAVITRPKVGEKPSRRYNPALPRTACRTAAQTINATGDHRISKTRRRIGDSNHSMLALFAATYCSSPSQHFSLID